MEPRKNRMIRIVPAVLFPLVACWLQWHFWSVFKPFVWFLFYPTVFFSSRLGGRSAGIASTLISACLVVYFFIPARFSFVVDDINSLYSVFLFILMGVLFSYTHERLEQARLRAVEAQEAVRVANEQLQEARISRLQVERKQTQDHLRVSEERFRSIFNHSPIAIGIGRRDDGILVEVNDAWLRLYGFGRDEMLGRAAAELNLYVSAAERDEIVAAINEHGQIVNREVRLRRKSGEIIAAQYSAEIIELGGEPYLQVMISDITEWKRNEIAREATVELLRICTRADQLPVLMQDLMHYFQKVTGCEAVGVRLADGDEYPYYVTRGFAEEFVQLENKLCAHDPDGELIRDDAGHPVLDCMCGNILNRRFDPSKPFFTSHGSFWSSCTTELLASTTEAERQARTRNRCNSEGYESVALIPLRYRGETYGLFQFNDREKGRFTPENIALYEELVDYVSITLSKLKSDRTLRDSEQALQEKNSEMERFIYMISHDLKSPLVTVKTFLGYLEQDIASSDAARVAKDLDYMRGAAVRMGRMLDDLLELSRVGRKANPPQVCTFLELAQTARNMVAGRIAEHGVAVRFGEDDVVLYGDCTRLLEIWQNLLENACKFMGDQAHPTIEIGVEGTGRNTLFFVRDNGIGIDPQCQEKIFGLFEKMDRNSEGSGLGLALVRRIVELNGGTIRVESQGAGQGTCFRFTLPGAVHNTIVQSGGLDER